MSPSRILPDADIKMRIVLSRPKVVVQGDRYRPIVTKRVTQRRRQAGIQQRTWYHGEALGNLPHSLMSVGKSRSFSWNCDKERNDASPRSKNQHVCSCLVWPRSNLTVPTTSRRIDIRSLDYCIDKQHTFERRIIYPMEVVVGTLQVVDKIIIFAPLKYLFYRILRHWLQPPRRIFSATIASMSKYAAKVQISDHRHSQ